MNDRVCVALTGCVESQKLHMVYGLGDGFKNKLIVTFSDLRVKELAEDYRFYDRDVMVYPSGDLIFTSLISGESNWLQRGSNVCVVSWRENR